jgi:NAD(P)-dependent dehydrogenase (short-subunit alcohol dehydrogenase family)
MTSAYASVRYSSLQSRSVLITGGASGLGAAMVAAFVEQGARVAFLDIDVASATELAARTGANFVVDAGLTQN